MFLFRLLCAVEPIAIPMVQEADENETQTSTSFTSHVYGMPLGKMYACIKVKGFSKRRDCTQDFMPADDVTVAIGDFDNSTAYFTWSYGHTDRGNLFGKATWTLSGDSSEEHFQLASFTLRILNPYNGGKPKKFVFKTKNVQLISAAAKNDLGELKLYVLVCVTSFQVYFVGRHTTCGAIHDTPSFN